MSRFNLQKSGLNEFFGFEVQFFKGFLTELMSEVVDVDTFGAAQTDHYIFVLHILLCECLGLEYVGRRY